MKTRANSSHASELSALPYTKHATVRMNQRRLSNEVVLMVITYGRIARVRGAEIFAVGRKEIERYLSEGIYLSKCEGVHVVCSSDGSILTVYRNNNFRGLRPRTCHRHDRLAA